MAPPRPHARRALEAHGEREATPPEATPEPRATSSRPPAAPARMATERVSAWYGATQVLHEVSLPLHDRCVTAIIGPSGCGKSTLLRCLNRMHEVTPGARVTGRVLLEGVDVYGREVNPARLRRYVGMVFQKPNPFPTMSIRDNVLAGPRMAGLDVPDEDELVVRCLERAALFDEVRDRLDSPGATLSGGQQQRLCVARALAMDPHVLLMDEPCSSLDPAATAKIEELVFELRAELTIVIVTHNMQQAARVSDYTAFLHRGRLVEHDRTNEIFTKPREPDTEDYISGRFG